MAENPERVSHVYVIDRTTETKKGKRLKTWLHFFSPLTSFALPASFMRTAWCVNEGGKANVCE